MIDLRTIMLSYTVSSALCTLVMVVLWLQNRKQFVGLGLWAVGFAMQLIAIPLFVLKGVASEFVTVFLSNALVIAGMGLIHLGLDRFIEKRTSLLVIFGATALFIFGYAYFSWGTANVLSRELIGSLATLVFAARSARITWPIMASGEKNLTYRASLIFVAYALVAVSRILLDLLLLLGQAFAWLEVFNALSVMAYQMLTILLTFSLFLMVNRHLVRDLESDVVERKVVEQLLRDSEDKYRRLVELSPDGILIHLQGKIIFANTKAARILGPGQPTELLGKPLLDFVHPAYRATVVERVRKMTVEKIDAPLIEEKLIRLDGTSFDAEVTAIPFPFNHEAAVLVVFRDITDRKHIEGKLRESEERLKAVIEGAQLGFSDWNIVTGEINRNERWAEMLGYSLTELEANFQTWSDLMHPADRAAAERTLQDHLDGKTTVHRSEYRLRAKDGSYRWILDQGKVIERDEQWRPLRLTATHTDVTERKHLEEEIRENQNRLRTVFDASQAGILLVSPTGVITFANQQLANMFKCALSEIIGSVYFDHVHPDYRHVSEENTRRLQLGEIETLAAERYYICEDGSAFWGYLSGRRLDDEAGNLLYWVESIVDVTELKQAEEELRQAKETIEASHRELEQALAREQVLARIDSLLEIYNRRYFFELATREFAIARRYQRELALIMFDVDFFKQVNDKFGHAAGDELLRRVAVLACKHLRETDIFARYGGEEFIVMLPYSTAQQAAVVAERLRQNVAEQSLVVAPAKLAKITVSFGVAELTAETENLDQLVLQADQALYAAKGAGRNRVEVYSAVAS